MQRAFFVSSAKRTVEFLKQEIPNETSNRPVNRILSLKLGIFYSPICKRCQVETETTSYMLCECVALAELIFCHLRKHFMELCDYDEIPLCKILYFLRGTRTSDRIK
jgi:hypothetical protein